MRLEDSEALATLVVNANGIVDHACVSTGELPESGADAESRGPIDDVAACAAPRVCGRIAQGSSPRAPGFMMPCGSK
jgi:hypothetical protein